MTNGLYLMTALAGALYVLSPGPAFLALFSLSAAHGRPAGARFVSGHLVGDLFWGTLAFAAIIGVNQLGPMLFDLLGLFCGLYLVWLGVKAVRSKGEVTAPVGAGRPLATGVLFGLTNPKAYPVSVAMFTALTAHYASGLSWDSAPYLMAAAFAGFVAADILLVWMAGLAPVRRFFLRHGRIVTRCVGLMFIAFGTKSLFDATRGFASRA
ncbi:LysE family translocator [Ancylobacter sp. 6x-1]|uniref:LysE family translocator n=1 Tax=Ancylobacter crimeensis TaxID=2579147 RepID=A0ABT0DE67_9HYPH|nr:LysE family translocator [Ancylobacter crimeensis]MCK0198251.1 LysE family translocator [Ancylobacter crimeensis]